MTLEDEYRSSAPTPMTGLDHTIESEAESCDACRGDATFWIVLLGVALAGVALFVGATQTSQGAAAIDTARRTTRNASRQFQKASRQISRKIRRREPTLLERISELFA